MAGTVQRDWTWNLNVKKGVSNEQNVKVCVWDFDSTTFAFTPVLTNASGNIVQQELRENIWSVTGTTETPDPQTPHTASLVKYGNRPLGLQINFISARSDTLFVETDSFITETTKATVEAYTGITISHAGEKITLDGSGISPITTWAQLYDYMQSEAYDSPQKGFPSGIMRTTDGENFLLDYDLELSGMILDGQNKSVQFGTGKKVICLTTGRVDDLNVIGSVNWATSTTMNNLDVSGTILFTESVTVNVTDCTLNIVDTEGTPTQETVVLNLSVTSSITTNNDPTNITVNVSYNLTITGLPAGIQVTIAKVSDRSELYELENTTGADVVYSYGNSEAGTIVDILFVGLTYDPNVGNILDYTLPSADATIPVTLVEDRVYNNP